MTFRHAIYFMVLLMVAGVLAAAPVSAQEADTWYVVPLNVTWSWPPSMSSSAPYSHDNAYTFVVPADSEFRGLIYDLTVDGNHGTATARARTNWTGTYNDVYPAYTNQQSYMTDGSRTVCDGFNGACGVDMAYDQSGISVSRTTWSQWGGRIAADGDTYTLNPRMEVRYDTNNTNRYASATISNVYAIYYGIPPSGANFTATPTTGEAPLYVEFTDTSVDARNWLWYIDDMEYSEVQHESYLFAQPGTYDVTLVINRGDPDQDSHTVTITVTEPAIPDVLVRPFSAATEGSGLQRWGEDITAVDAWASYSRKNSGQFTDSAALSVSARNTEVHAAKAGTIISVNVVGDSGCFVGQCVAVFNSGKAGDDPGAALYFVSYNAAGVYQVAVQTSSTEVFTYLVHNPFDYITTGETIDAGCVLGETVTVTEPVSGLYGWIADILSSPRPPMGGWLYNDAAVYDAGMTIIQRVITAPDNTLYGIPVASNMTEYPEDEIRACNYTPSACLSADPELRRQDRWDSIGQPEFQSSSGVILNPGDAITQQLSLSDSTAYAVNAYVRSIGNADGNLQIQLGQTTLSFTAPTGQFLSATAPAATYVADLGLFYSFTLRNTSSVPVLVQSACVRDETSGGIRPGQCYFANYTFDGLPATTGWATSGDVYDGLSTGEIIMRDGGSIAQPVLLHPDGVNAKIYFVRVIATVGGDIETLKADFTSTAGFQWEYPSANGFEGFVAPDSSTLYNVGNFFTGYENGINILPNNEVRFWAEVPVAATENSTFTIKAAVNSANPDLYLRVREVCIDDPFDNFDDPDAWIPPPPFAPKCDGISVPNDNEISSWIFYHWSNLDRFFTCDLMILLNRMHDVAQKTYSIIGWQFRYIQSTLMMTANWVGNDLIGWLNGHFTNMAVGQVTTVNSQESAGLWDVLLALVNVVLGPITDMLNDIVTTVLDIINQAVGLLFTVLTSAITLVLAVVAQALNLLLLAQMLLSSIITAWNTATPTPIPGMTLCSVDPKGSAWCIAMWVLENTIFSGTGAYIIPVLVGILSIHLLLWVVSELRRAVIQTGQGV